MFRNSSLAGQRGVGTSAPSAPRDRPICRAVQSPQKPQQKPLEADAPPPAQQTNGLWALVSNGPSFASQLLSHFNKRKARTQVEAQEQAQQASVVLKEAGAREKELHTTTPAADIMQFLQPASLWEIKYVRMLSSMCAITYSMDYCLPKALERRHKLQLVTNSRSCSLVRHAYECSLARTPEDVLAEGDGMAASPALLAGYSQPTSSAKPTESVSNIVVLPRELSPSKQRPGSKPEAKSGSAQPSSSSKASGKPQQQSVSPADLVAAKLAEAAAAATSAAVAASAATGLARALPALSQAVASVLPVLPGTQGGASSSNPALALVEQLANSSSSSASSSAAPAGSSARTADTTSTNSSAGSRASASSSSTAPTTISRYNNPCSIDPNAPVIASSVREGGPCPSEWYVCDDPESNVRYFVVQGSDTLDHWRLNLTFDPVPFEDPSLGVKVHRGVYEAAKALYEEFLPLVQEHMDSHPLAKVCFTGHSIGGSMAMLLALMYKHRHVLTASSLAPVYTFGAPAVFCELGCIMSSLSQSSASSMSSVSLDEVSLLDQSGLLKTLGLADDHVRNVIMHRDIVPRAFACDYSLVADILRGWGSGFREHHALQRTGRKHLYYFTGKLMVLQPDPWHTFAQAEKYHPMLPPRADVFHVVPATLTSALSAASARSDSKKAGKAVGKQVGTVVEAVWELMDSPHPLEMLSDTGSYLEWGSISRYHNPDNYTRALGRVAALRRRHQREQLTAGRPVAEALASRLLGSSSSEGSMDGGVAVRGSKDGADNSHARRTVAP